MRYFLHDTNADRIRIIDDAGLEYRGTQAEFAALEPEYPGLPEGMVIRYQTDAHTYLQDDAGLYHADAFDALPYCDNVGDPYPLWTYSPPEAASAPRRNLLINAQFAVNQRAYASGTATTVGNQYTVDRWRVVTSGQNMSWTTSGGKRTVTAPAGGLEQVIEGEFVQSGNYTISWEGTATCTVGGTARTTGESFTLTGGSNITARFNGGTLANPQLERGAVQTPFDWQSIGAETSICYRYTWVVGFGFLGRIISETRVQIACPFPLQMRASPATALLTTSPLITSWIDGIQTGSNSAIISSSLDSKGIDYLNIGGFAGLTAGSTVLFRTARLLLVDAEIYT